ncbi:MAG: DMT family transporter [Bacteroidetes bacterium]|nr:DMT family transporter [Bacteroidota bacterium]
MAAIRDNYKWIVIGTVFAILWASASTATKYGLLVSQPLVIAQARFAVAGIIMIAISHIVQKNQLPTAVQWKFIMIYGLLNITIYLGCYVVAMQQVTAGVGALAVGTNPIFISFISLFFLKHKLTPVVLIALLLGITGVLVASWPLLKESSVSYGGLALLLFSMLSYSAGAIYFSSKDWGSLSNLTINGWQTFIGGIFLLPITIFFYHSSANHYNEIYWLSVLWLAIPVSIFAVQAWLWLLKINTVRAGLWLFLCPAFGFIIAAIFLGDKITWYTIIGLAFVMVGLAIARRKKTTIADN